jgi:hypothetical protein
VIRHDPLAWGDSLTDQEMWDNAVAVVRGEYAALAGEEKAGVESVAGLIRLKKEEIFSLAENKDASKFCESCRGACCAKGKYHFTVVDLLVYFAGDADLFSPSFCGDLCPYLGSGRCLMSPSFRPLTCITFHCEPLEMLLSPAELERMYSLERELRNHYAQLETFFGTRLTQGLLLNYEVYRDGRSTGILANK